MKKISLILLALLLAFGLAFVSCDNDTTGGGSGSNTSRIQGTYTGGFASIVFTGSNCSMYLLGSLMVSGRFTVSSDTVIITVTAINTPGLIDAKVGDKWTLEIIDENTLYDPGDRDYYRKK